MFDCNLTPQELLTLLHQQKRIPEEDGRLFGLWVVSASLRKLFWIKRFWGLKKRLILFPSFVLSFDFRGLTWLLVFEWNCFMNFNNSRPFSILLFFLFVCLELQLKPHHHINEVLKKRGVSIPALALKSLHNERKKAGHTDVDDVFTIHGGAKKRMTRNPTMRAKKHYKERPSIQNCTFLANCTCPSCSA